MLLDDTPWVFVSHASADLQRVREVRNFMEQNGAGPILFHLRSMTDPEQFWPLIVREIESRDFFLFCDSAAAQRSEWVQREREAVERIRQSRPIRIGRVSMDAPQIDFDGLRGFLLNLSVHLIWPEHRSHEPVMQAMKDLRYKVSGWGTRPERLEALRNNETAWDDFEGMLRLSANSGWLLIVLDNALASSAAFRAILPRPAYRSRFMVILAEKIKEPLDWLGIAADQIVDGSDSLVSAANVAGQRMLLRGPQ
jgi:hypothetical protein